MRSASAAWRSRSFSIYAWTAAAWGPWRDGGGRRGLAVRRGEPRRVVKALGRARDGAVDADRPRRVVLLGDGDHGPHRLHQRLRAEQDGLEGGGGGGRVQFGCDGAGRPGTAVRERGEHVVAQP